MSLDTFPFEFTTFTLVGRVSQFPFRGSSTGKLYTETCESDPIYSPGEGPGDDLHTVLYSHPKIPVKTYGRTSGS